jgi:hypothetical protein
VPEFYCNLLITLPSPLNPIIADQQLDNLYSDVYHAELNYILEPASSQKFNAVLPANDPYYTSLQGSLHSVPGYTNANINCDTAWTINTGEPTIKVGIYDTGVDFAHPDFAGANTSGMDFFNNMQPTTNYDDFNHGTAVSGIVGAVRNNNLGVAGIAGGDKSINKQGVSMVDCRVVNNGVCPHNIFANGILKGAQAMPAGLGLNIMNMSIMLQGSNINTVTTAAHIIVDQMNFANRNGVAMVAAKGNFNVGFYTYPADYSEETTMSVGSNGVDGHHARIGVNSSRNSASWGNIDFVAPGTDSLVKSLSNNGNGDIEVYDGTSMATPHVSGAVALMMSYINTVTPTWDNLVHEDCENILQRTCTDLTDTPTYFEKVGYDTVTGWGRINATQALKKINKNFYKIRHVDETHFSTSFNRVSTLIHPNLMMAWPNYNSVSAGTYSTDVYVLTTTLNYVLPSTEQVIGAWPLFKDSYGTRDTSVIITDRPYHCEIVSANGTTAVLKTYYYHNLNFPISYMPFSPINCKSAFSLYTYDPSGTIGVKENEKNKINFALYPNPNNGEYEVTFNSLDNEDLTYNVYNIVGQLVNTGSYKAQYGENTIKINMTGLTNGIYILNIFDNKSLVYKHKVVKQ